MAVLNGCCCCSLKTGAIIIGIVYLAFSLLDIGSTGNSLRKGEYKNDERDKFVHALNEIADGQLTGTIKDASLSFDKTFGTKVSGDVNQAFTEPQVTKTQLITALVIGSIQALCALLLLIGACNEKSGLVLPWVIVQSILVVISVIVGVVISVALLASEGTVTAGIIVIVFICLYVALSLYFILVVYSLYQNLRDNPRRYV